MNTRNIQPAPHADSSDEFNFQPIRSTRAFEEIAAQIRTELAEGRLRVGNRLPSERALSEQFGISHATLQLERGQACTQPCHGDPTAGPAHHH